jgi:adenine-specific DNA-methyltransferase
MGGVRCLTKRSALTALSCGLVRYIGNKTRLLPFILEAVASLGLSPGAAHDACAGTAVVGRELKACGWRVASSDIMSYSYVFQRAYVVAQRVPSFAELRAGDSDLRRAMRSQRFRTAVARRGPGALSSVCEYLARWLEPERGFIAAHYGPAGGRMYFTDENAMRIDAIRRRLHEWRAEGLVGDDAFYILLAALLEAADRVANTAGVYAAYIKSWQPNAKRALDLEPRRPIRGARGSTAHHGDAQKAATQIGPIELLYIDPPYNSRQYAGYYHIPEVIARGWFNDVPVVRGKTGLIRDPGGTTRSAWCSSKGAERALRDLLAATGARHVLVSYNSEGVLNEDVLQRVLSDAAVGGQSRRFVREYRRYRADRDHAKRRYRADALRELLYHAELR